MKTIALTQGKVTLVDDDVYEWASKFKWYASKSRQTFYVGRKIRLETGKQQEIRLHQEIVQPGNGLQVDHRDGDGLNNLRENLRPATQTQNRSAYRSPKKNTSSKYRGVGWHSAGQKWSASIRVNKKAFWLGLFTQEEDAARAYDAAAKNFFGEFAYPNFSSRA